MKNRLSAILAISVAVSGLLLLLYFGSTIVFLERFSALERASIVQDVERAKDLISRDIDQLSTTNGDYSGWDDAYSFVQGGSPQFVKTNLDKAIYPKLKLNFLAYVDRSGKPVYAQGFDYRKGSEVPFPAELQPFMGRNGSLVAHKSAKSEISGILRLPQKLALVASRPVLKSDYSGPVAGTLLVGRYIDREFVEQIAHTAHLSLQLEKADDKNLPADFRRAMSRFTPGKPLHFEVRGDEKIICYAPVSAINGGYACVVRVDQPRTIYLKGKETVRYFLLWASLVGIVSGLLIFWLFDRLMLSRQRREESEARFRAVVESAAHGILLLDPATFTIIESNAAFASWIGWQKDRLPGEPLLRFIDEEASRGNEEIERSLVEKREVRFRHRDTSALFAELAAKQIPFRGGTVLSLFIHDTTERRRLEEQLMFQANHDPLTGLPNRNLLNDRLFQAIASAERGKGIVAVAILDLDDFKVVNDNFGHQVGDKLLVAVTERLKRCIRSSDTFGRMGGDEFIHITTSLKKVEDTITIAETFQQLLREPFMIGTLPIYVNASIGIAHYPMDGQTVEQLFQKADTALYHVKGKGKNSFEFYNEEMNRVLHEHTEIAAQLRHAIDREELRLVYQPKFDASNMVVGVETLLRWENAELGVIPPSKFIPIAEESDLILPIGNWVLLMAAREARRWKEAGLGSVRISVNLSARQFNDPHLVGMVKAVIDDTGLAPDLLELELTESAMMSNMEHSIERMHQLKALGIALSIDDFGTGYASLSYLTQFPLDRIKIDKSFVDLLSTDRNMPAIVQTIVLMAHSLGMSVTAEGVETAEQLKFLRDLGCEEVQGYLFSPPVTADALVNLVTGAKTEAPVQHQSTAPPPA